jgi:AcrR family transcriptional regulator
VSESEEKRIWPDRRNLIERKLFIVLYPFSLKGLAATSTDDLLHAMDVGRQSMYDTFGGKQVLFLKARAVYFAESVRAINVDSRPQGHPLLLSGEHLSALKIGKIFPVRTVSWESMPSVSSGCSRSLPRTSARPSTTETTASLRTAKQRADLSV